MARVLLQTGLHVWALHYSIAGLLLLSLLIYYTIREGKFAAPAATAEYRAAC